MMARNIVAAATVLLASTSPIVAQDKSADACPFERGTYALAEGGKASLQLYPLDSTVGIAGTMMTLSGAEIYLTISSSNGYAASYADIDVGTHDITSIALAFTDEMHSVRFSAGDPAPKYLIFPGAGFEAYVAQRAETDQIDIPEGAWRLTGCGQ